MSHNATLLLLVSAYPRTPLQPVRTKSDGVQSRSASPSLNRISGRERKHQGRLEGTEVMTQANVRPRSRPSKERQILK